MQVSKVWAGLFLAGSVIVTGCTTPDKPAEPAPVTAPATKEAVAPTPPKVAEPVVTPATKPAPEVAKPVVPTPEVVKPATTPAAPAITATHVITKAQPYFTEVPATPTTASAGMFPSGTKVLVFSFSGDYAKVTAEDGISGWTAIDGLEPISTKKK